MNANLSGQFRTRRKEISPKVREARQAYEALAAKAIFRAYPSLPNFGAELCLLDSGEMLELFWSIFNLGGEAPGGWHQVTNLKLHFERPSDSKTVMIPLSDHIAGFHAWYRMRGGDVSILPHSSYLNLEAGLWNVVLTGELQDAQPLCLFADSFGDLFHLHGIKKYYDEVREKLRAAHYAADEDPAPVEPFRLFAGELNLKTDHTGLIRDKQSNRLSAVAVSYSDVKDVAVPKLTPPVMTPLDPLNYLRKQLYCLHEQSVKYNYCPYNTVNYWTHEPKFEREHFNVFDRFALFNLEALVPLYRATGDADVYRTARKSYEQLRRNIWPAPGIGESICHGDRTHFGSALHIGGLCDAVCTFVEIDGDPRWLEPFHAGMRGWPMHPRLPRPLMDQDAWGNEELNSTGTYNMVTHFTLAMWRMGHLLKDEVLTGRAETILNDYTFRGEVNGIWPYRPGNYPSHHYDMYLKWQLARLLLTGADRWVKDASFLARMRRAVDSSLREYAREENGELKFIDWTHDKNVTHPGNAAAQASGQIDVLMAAAIYVDEGYIEPLQKALRGVYRLLVLPEVERCWHATWFHRPHGALLNLSLHGFHVEGKHPRELKIVRDKVGASRREPALK